MYKYDVLHSAHVAYITSLAYEYPTVRISPRAGITISLYYLAHDTPPTIMCVKGMSTYLLPMNIPLHILAALAWPNGGHNGSGTNRTHYPR